MSGLRPRDVPVQHSFRLDGDAPRGECTAGRGLLTLDGLRPAGHVLFHRLIEQEVRGQAGCTHCSFETGTASWPGSAAAIGPYTSPAADAQAPIRDVRAAMSREWRRRAGSSGVVVTRRTMPRLSIQG
ncbi:hypothetical protein BB341_30520 (plasmid) [Streptomyces clavuligerus]|uniref:Uncharacterized protein n=1 Tax=Streptomyces clavuligerus TaxID=1901 RepID=Q6TMN6_STRCL|nr:hypothetical protein pSCL2.8.25.2 [Streptomyces clavuligerus]ANW22640.1 hypothetical protein BB341_30520 [Streptomyces clavuligerus]AXU16891.1 hypothetical protein D1794_29465 [Streptomyces clavuligerus]AXU17499.1 hypothetical protein D1794_33690 [Streptomyces clavuligerus]EDY52625.1 conserved hypothetical protein [Streptomyces clavuligerus]